jgi:GntR family transcriptional regulator/MocR family aminotransferase
MREGHYGRHIRRMREIYSERQQVLMTESRKRLKGLVEVSSIEAGLQTVGWLADGVSGITAAEAAAKRGVEVVPLSRYSTSTRACIWNAQDGAREGLQLGFAAIEPAQIKDGVRELATALEGLRVAKKPANTSA